jgi:hypothetical protein
MLSSDRCEGRGAKLRYGSPKSLMAKRRGVRFVIFEREFGLIPVEFKCPIRDKHDSWRNFCGHDGLGGLIGLHHGAIFFAGHGTLSLGPRRAAA